MTKNKTISSAKIDKWFSKIFANPFLIGFIVLLGIALRLVLLVQNRPFFIDEAALASQVVITDWLGFFKQLDYQFSPPLFSIGQKISSSLFGAEEWAFRIFPLLGGVASIIVFKKWMEKKLVSEIVWFPIALLALGWSFVHYSVEAKQYAIDVFCAVSLIYFALEKPWQNNAKHTLYWAIGGALALWLSMPAIFVLASIGIYFLIPFFKDRTLSNYYGLFAIGSFWLINFAWYYYSLLSIDMDISTLQSFHSDYFFPIVPTSFEELTRAGNILYSFIRTIMGGTFLPLLLGVILGLLGLYKNWKRDKSTFFLLALPILFAIVVSAIGAYSLLSRLTLFFMPILIYWMGLGLQSIYKLNKPILNWCLVPLLFLSIINQNSLRYFTQNFEVENMPHLITWIQEEQPTTDQLYIYFEGKPSFVFYQNHAQRKEEYKLNNYTLGKFDERPDEISQRYANEKIWLLCSHISAEILQQWISEFSTKRKLLKIEKSKAGAAILFSPVQAN